MVNFTYSFTLWQQIFKKYIEIELQLGNIDRCRRLYEKYLEWSPENCYAWSKYAELERSLSETERARGIFELAIAQPALDMPELLWKVLILAEYSSFLERALFAYFHFPDCIFFISKSNPNNFETHLCFCSPIILWSALNLNLFWSECTT